MLGHREKKYRNKFIKKREGNRCIYKNKKEVTQQIWIKRFQGVCVKGGKLQQNKV